MKEPAPSSRAPLLLLCAALGCLSTLGVFFAVGAVFFLTSRQHELHALKAQREELEYEKRALMEDAKKVRVLQERVARLRGAGKGGRE